MSVGNVPSLVLIALLVSAAPARADVWVVDAGGGGDVTNVTSAVTLATDGDTILVRPGDYTGGFGSELLIFGKALSIVSDGTGTVLVNAVRVLGLDPGELVLLRGLEVVPSPLATTDQGLRVNGGEVWAEDCVFVGEKGIFTIGAHPASPGVLVDGGAHVVLMRCTAQGGVGVDTFFPYAPTPGAGGEGISVVGASVDVYGGEVIGGRGGDFVGFDGGLGPGGNGGHALSGSGAVVFVAGASLQAGDGGTGDELVQTPGFYRGGDGIELGGASAVRLLDVDIQPGQGGLDGNGAPGPAGVAVDVSSGNVTQHTATYREYALGAPTPEFGTLQLDYTGEPGDVFGVFFSLDSAHVPLPGRQGSWHLGSPLFGPYNFGPVGPSGTLSLSLPMPGFGIGPEIALVLREQVFVLETSGALLLGSPTVHVIVDGSL
jgi:hypothetical protein